MRPTILLFDIDGTLITSGGAGRRAIERAFAARTGRADAVAGFSFAGMTDRAIVRRGLETVRGDVTEALIDELIDAYLGFLSEEVRGAERYRVHEGIEVALEAACARAACAVGLGTGNVEPGARIKLSRVGLGERFSFGGFGSDSEDRAELLRIGAERGAARLGLSRAECRVVVIGDTPRDVAAAQVIGAEALAVATGPFAVEALAACGPTWVYPHLGVASAIEAMLGSE